MSYGLNWKIVRALLRKTDAKPRGRKGTATSTPFAQRARRDGHPFERDLARAISRASSAVLDQLQWIHPRPKERNGPGNPSNSGPARRSERAIRAARLKGMSSRGPQGDQPIQSAKEVP